MSEQSRVRADLIVNSLKNIEGKVNDLKLYAESNVKDPELITKLTNLAGETNAVANHVNKKLGKSAG